MQFKLTFVALAAAIAALTAQAAPTARTLAGQSVLERKHGNDWRAELLGPGRGRILEKMSSHLTEHDKEIVASKVDVRVGREEFRHSPTTRVNQCHRTASVFALSLLDRDIFSPSGIHYAVRLTFRKLVSRVVSAVDAESL
ncbi:hypothetical protein B0H14DRAFT_2568117 [Mycena olivaceomarginata]|nr:hypothetical protein B0H14DRAFT_2568117 [Mycena olivaceomarginata]